MSAPVPPQPALLRHILPVLVGGLLVAMLTVVTNNWLMAHGWIPEPSSMGDATGAMLFVVLFQAVITSIGSHMAARLAPDGQPRIRYALAVGVLLAIVGVAAASQAAGSLPTWYLLARIVSPIPASIVGGGTATRVLSQRRQS